MNNKHFLGSIFSTSSKDEYFYNNKTITGSLNAIIIADAYCFNSDKILHKFLSYLVTELSKEIGNNCDINDLDFKQYFTKYNKIITEKFKKNKITNFYGASIICLVESENKIKIAYLGNGAIWHIRRRFDELMPILPFSWPWNAINLLNPHYIHEEDGKNELYRFISNNENIDCTPTIIEIEKDYTQGDIFMICTSSIYSEICRYTKQSEGIDYIILEDSMQVFFEKLRVFFNEHRQLTNYKLEKMLKKYLQTIKFDGNTTLGVLITKAAINYHLKNLITE